MPTVTTKDGTKIFYRDSGSGQPIVFSHGWPLSADGWGTQLLSSCITDIALSRMTVVDGRATQTADGQDVDHYADDLATLTAHLELKKAVHVGHSTGGGEGRALSGAAWGKLGGQGRTD